MRTILLCIAFALAATGCAHVDTPPAGGRTWSVEALDALKRVAEAAPDQGLPSQDAALAEIARFQQLARQDARAAEEVDSAADALFSELARTFARGATDPTQADPEWRIPPPPEPDLGALRRAVVAGASPATLLQGLLPSAAEYRALSEELARTVGEAPGTLDADGLDREARIAKLRATLERWRWLPRDMPARRVEVRIAQFETTLYRPDTPPVVHLAIVGAHRTPTPSFTAEITSLTLNPSWEPPSSILHGELLPKFRNNPGAIAQEGFDVIGPSADVVDPMSVDWGAQPFPYRLRQRPGPGNALGRVRFDLPNPFAIYLHDTSNRALFAGADRALSHGCIRVDDPVGLAERVIDSSEWDLAALEAALVDYETKTIPLTTPMPAYVLYLTASARDDGAVFYFDDLYQRDAAVVAAIDATGAITAAAGEIETPP